MPHLIAEVTTINVLIVVLTTVIVMMEYVNVLSVLLEMIVLKSVDVLTHAQEEVHVMLMEHVLVIQDTSETIVLE